MRKSSSRTYEEKNTNEIQREERRILRVRKKKKNRAFVNALTMFKVGSFDRFKCWAGIRET